MKKWPVRVNRNDMEFYWKIYLFVHLFFFPETKSLANMYKLFSNNYLFHRLLAPVGCPDCASLAFCSVECRDKAVSTYHKYECKILDMLIGSGMSVLCHVALRTITQDGLAPCLDIYKDKTLDSAQTLCGHSDKREPKDFLQRSLMAAFLLRCLQKCEFFPDKKEVDESRCN